MVNIMFAFANVAILIARGKIILKTLKHYHENKGKKFISKDIGIETEYWK